VGTSLLLASSFWMGPQVLRLITVGRFILGVVLLFVALGLEFAEMRIGVTTVGMEVKDTPPPG